MTATREIRNKNSAHRAAFTLIEMIMMGALAGVLLGLSVKLVGQSFFVHQRAMDHMAVMQGLNRLHKVLQKDTHLARRCETAGGQLEFERPFLAARSERTLLKIRFEVVAIDGKNYCVRTVTGSTDGQVQDRFPLPPNSQLRFEILKTSSKEAKFQSDLLQVTIQDWLPQDTSWLFCLPKEFSDVLKEVCQNESEKADSH